MDIKDILKDKKTLAIFGVAGGVAGLLVFMTKGSQQTSSYPDTGDEDVSNEINAVSDRLQTQQQQANQVLAQQYNAGLQGITEKFNTQISQMESNFATLTQQQKEQNTQAYNQLVNSFNQSQQSLLGQLTDLQNKINNASMSYQPSIPVEQPTQSSSKTTIYAGGADYANARAKYGNNPNVNIVDVSHMDTSTIQFKSSDVVLGGVNAYDSATGSHGVTSNSGSATRLVGDDRNATAKLLDDYMNNISRSTGKTVTSSSGKTSSGGSSKIEGTVINRYSDKSGSYVVTTKGEYKVG